MTAAGLRRGRRRPNEKQRKSRGGVDAALDGHLGGLR